MKKCICGCGENIVRREGKTPFQFRARRVVDKKHFAVYRKASGWFPDKTALGKKKPKGGFESIAMCKKCKLPIIHMTKDGFGIVDSKQFCICKRKWSEERKAWV